MDRVFLGLDQPALHAAAEYIGDRYAGERVLDLGQTLIVTPGSRAGRRLNTLLWQQSKRRGIGYLPPEIVTEGQVPELLYVAQFPFASEWTQQLCWARAIRMVESNVRRSVFPHVPIDGSDRESHPWSEKDWISLGRLLMSAYRELGGERLSFADVAQSNLSVFPDRHRWIAMAKIQDAYLDELRKLNLWDRQTARLVAINKQECHTQRDIIVVASADLTDTLRAMLRQVTRHVTILVHAPESWADRFFDDGCIRTAGWLDEEISLPSEWIRTAGTVTEQAHCVVQQLVELEGKFAGDEITIGCPDDQLIAAVQRSLAEHRCTARWGPGRSICESRPYRLLQELSLWIDDGDADAFAALIRHPDVEAWLWAKIGLSPIVQFDQFQSELRPVPKGGNWTEQRLAADDKIQQAWHALREITQPLRGEKLTIAAWTPHIERILNQIYGDFRESPSGPGQWTVESAAAEFRALFAQQNAIPEQICTALTASEAIDLMLRFVQSQLIAEPTNESAIELLGWLELPLDDAPVLVLTGMHEGIVPRSSSSDLFLPDMLRRHLGIEDDAHRYAREKYALSVMTAARNHVRVVVGKMTLNGEPVRPSRLLLTGDDRAVCERWQYLLDGNPEETIPASSSDGSIAASPRSFGFQVPQPRRVATFDTLSVTDFATYLNCPYTFYLNKVEGLQYRDFRPSELDALVFGSVLHHVLEQFGRGEYRDSSAPQEIFEELQRLLMAEQRERFGECPSPAIQLQFKQMERRLNRFATEQARRAEEGWKIDQVEAKYQGATITVPEGTVNIVGKIDRIDVHAETGERVIFDYKTGNRITDVEKAHRQSTGEWRNLQLPLYRLIVREVVGLEVNDLGYIWIGGDGSKSPPLFQIADWGPSDFDSALEVARSVVSGILSQDFQPNENPWITSRAFENIQLKNTPEVPSRSHPFD